jgi:hypothetical protein
MVGRPTRLTYEQGEELRRRHAIYLANRPSVLMKEYGLNWSVMGHYLKTGQKAHYRIKTTEQRKQA